MNTGFFVINKHIIYHNKYCIRGISAFQLFSINGLSIKNYTSVFKINLLIAYQCCINPPDIVNQNRSGGYMPPYFFGKGACVQINPVINAHRREGRTYKLRNGRCIQGFRYRSKEMFIHYSGPVCGTELLLGRNPEVPAAPEFINIINPFDTWEMHLDSVIQNPD